MGERARALSRDLRALGLRLVVDDFGSGSSSLQLLREATADAIKLDRRCVQALPDDPRERATLAAVAALARELGFAIGACGIETAAQAHSLQGSACTTLQGWLYGHPMDAGRLEAAVRAQQGQHPTVAGQPWGALRPA